MPRYTEKRNVPVRLDNDELLHAGEKLSKGTADLVDLENKKKEINADFTAKMNKIKADNEVESRKISTGVEYRDVECDVAILPEIHKKIITRPDTGEVVEELKLTNDDLQYELNLIERKEENK